MPDDTPGAKSKPAKVDTLCPECKRPAPLHSASCPTIVVTDEEALKPTPVVEPDAKA